MKISVPELRSSQSHFGSNSFGFLQLDKLKMRIFREGLYRA